MPVSVNGTSIGFTCFQIKYVAPQTVFKGPASKRRRIGKRREREEGTGKRKVGEKGR